MGPEIAVPSPVAPRTPLHEQDQLRVMEVVVGPRAAGGRGAPPVGVHDPQPQVVSWAARASPSVPLEGIGSVLVLGTQPRVQRELKTVRVASDAADGHGYLAGAYEQRLARDGPGNHRVRTH